MLQRILLFVVLISGAYGLMSVSSTPIEGCAVAPIWLTTVQIANESAIIIWDSSTKTEHFIRRASFQTEASDFGFLVPTPNKPTLAEADDGAFESLRIITEPEIIDRKRATADGCGIGCATAPKFGAPGASKVDILEEKSVAGYDAVILQADDAEALNRWLKDHGYQSSPALKDWLKRYITQGWKITAFKIAKDDKEAHSVATKALHDLSDRETIFSISRACRSVRGGCVAWTDYCGFISSVIGAMTQR